MQKEIIESSATELGLSAAVTSFLTADNGAKAEKLLNQEGMEVGDIFTIVGFNDEVSVYNDNEYVEFKTTGSRATVAVSRLAGTPKVDKYFSDESFTLAGYGRADAIQMPRKQMEVIRYGLTDLKDKPLIVIAKEEECGNFHQTFYLFAFVKA